MTISDGPFNLVLYTYAGRSGGRRRGDGPSVRRLETARVRGRAAADLKQVQRLVCKRQNAADEACYGLHARQSP
jgi:hypothetical protein